MAPTTSWGGNVIDKALADVRTYNAAHKDKPLAVRLRVAAWKLGPEIVFQTGATNPKDFDGTIKMGIEYGATAIELWQDYGGFPTVPDEKLKQWAAMVEGNKRR